MYASAVYHSVPPQKKIKIRPLKKRKAKTCNKGAILTLPAELWNGRNVEMQCATRNLFPFSTVSIIVQKVSYLWPMTTLRTDSTHSGINIDYANGSGFVHGGSGPLTVYSDDEKNAIKELQNADNDTYYLFVVDNVTRLNADGTPMKDILAGYMPIGRQCGFLFGSPAAKYVAHELGHGAFGLHHTFSSETESFSAPQYSTNNLMDYADGATLNHKQWTWMHEKHGSGLFGFLADESEGEWTTDGHFYLLTYLGMLMGMSYEKAEELGRDAERPDTYVIAEEDLKKGFVVMGDGEKVDIKDHKVGDRLENTTWTIGGLQQRFHALTGGYHGVELAATAYAIKYRSSLGMTSDYNAYLLHRFGDVFAHFDYKKDDNGFDDVPLDKYIGALEDFFDGVGVHGVHIQCINKNDKYKIYDREVVFNEDVIYFVDGVFVSTYSRDETIKIIINSLLTADSKILRFNPISDEELSSLVEGWLKNRDYLGEIEFDLNMISIAKDMISIAKDGIINVFLPKIGEIRIPIIEVINTAITLKNTAISLKDTYEGNKNSLKAYYEETYSISELQKYFLHIVNSATLTKENKPARQNEYNMYGDEVTCVSSWTSGHAGDGSKPDEILRRSELFKLYANRTIELLSMITGINDKEDTAKKTIENVVNMGVEYAGDNEERMSNKLDGVFEFLIQLEKNKDKNEFDISIPIKYLPKELDTGIVWFLYSFIADKTFFKWDFKDSAEKQESVFRQYLKDKYKDYTIIGYQEKENVILLHIKKNI